MKRLIFCFDGTWNKLAANCPTNVVLVAEMIKPIASDGTPQIVYYDEGVGTAKNERFRGGAFGEGMMDNIREAYRFLLFNYEPGDHIYAFGFSRGAFTARSFVGFIRHAGILNVNNAKQIDHAIDLYRAVFKGDGDDSPEALKFRAEHCAQVCVSEWDRDWRIENYGVQKADAPTILEIKYVGVWDTVAALGVPKLIPGATWLNRKFRFHDAKLTSKVQRARHAVAIDERRVTFEPVLWDNVAELNANCDSSNYDPQAPYQQKWFPGVHGSVGGGGPERGLSDGALAWVLKGARDAELELRTEGNSRAYEIQPDPYVELRNDPIFAWHERGIFGILKRAFLMSDRIGPTDIVNVSASARRRWLAQGAELPDRRRYRPATLDSVKNKIVAMENLPDADGKQIKAMREHTVVRGDTLGKLAEKYLGNAKLYIKIFEANRDLIDDVDEIFVGTTLKIPKPDDSA